MTKHGTILLIESDENDLLHFRKAFAEADVVHPLQTVDNGEDAVKYLSGAGVYANRESFPLPFLILLDLKMEGDDGFAVLRWLYDRPGLRKKFTVVTLNSDNSEVEVQLAYELGAQSYVVKPRDLKQLVNVVRRLKEYWIDLNLLPGDVC